MFVFKRKFIIYLSWKKGYVPFLQRKKGKTDQKHGSKRRKGISKGRRGGGDKRQGEGGREDLRRVGGSKKGTKGGKGRERKRFYRADLLL